MKDLKNKGGRKTHIAGSTLKIQAHGNSNPAHELFTLHLNSIWRTQINSSAQHTGEEKEGMDARRRERGGRLINEFKKLFKC